MVHFVVSYCIIVLKRTVQKIYFSLSNIFLKVSEKGRNIWEVYGTLRIIASNYIAVVYIYIYICVCVCVCVCVCGDLSRCTKHG